MSLIDIWKNSPEQLQDKHVQQIVTFSGEGRLRDDNVASSEFREYLKCVDFALITRYANDCLKDSFNDSGIVLQDIINEMGRRLGFSVTNGRYRGSAAHIGHDGLWKLPNGHSIIIEVKTSDAFRLNLDTIAEYRERLITNGTALEEDKSSILIIVGREDTGGLESQIRGSRYAWDIRLISIDSIIRLINLKEKLDEPAIVSKIYNILIPREFTRLDEIVDILLSTAEDVEDVEIDVIDDDSEGDKDQDKDYREKSKNVNFYDSCIIRLENYLKEKLLKRSRVTYSSPNEKLTVICLVSKKYPSRGDIYYWFAFHLHHKESLYKSDRGFVSFACGSDKKVLLIPFEDFSPLLDGMNTTEREGTFAWHVKIYLDGDQLILHPRRGEERIDLTKYLITNIVESE